MNVLNLLIILLSSTCEISHTHIFLNFVCEKFTARTATYFIIFCYNLNYIILFYYITFYNK